MIDEKEAAELVELDELQFFIEPPDGLRMVHGPRRIARLEPTGAQLGQGLRSGGTVRSAKVGKAVAEIAGQIECLAALGNGQSRRDSIRTVSVQRNDFVQWPQVKFAVRTSGAM